MNDLKPLSGQQEFIPSVSCNINLYATKKERSTENCFNRPEFYRVGSANDGVPHSKFRRHVSYNMIQSSKNLQRGSGIRMYNNADIEEYTSLSMKRKTRPTDTSTYLTNGHRIRKPRSINKALTVDDLTMR